MLTEIIEQATKSCSIEKSECLICREIYGGSIWRKAMKAPVGLFFQVAPNPGHLNHYFSYVEKLKPELEKHDGTDLVKPI